MKRLICNPIFAAVVLIIIHAQECSANAGVYATLNFDQAVYAAGPNNHIAMPAIVTGTSTPIQQTVTVNDMAGGTITTTYNVTDNGSVATLDINTNGSLSALGNSINETTNGSGVPVGTNFSFTVPTSYTAMVVETGSGFESLNALGVGVTDLSDSTRSFSGLLSPGTTYYFQENWGTYNTGLGSQYTNETGSGSVAITFTATEPVPEPSSAMLIALPAIALLTRRPSKACGCGV